MPALQHFWRDPELPFLEGRRATGSLSCYAPHTHDSFSIGIVDGGHSVFALGEQRQAIVPGDVVLVRAGDVHCCNPSELASWSYRMFHLDTDWLAALLDETPATRGLLASLQSQVLRAPQAVHLLDRMTQALEVRNADLQAEVITCLHELMLLCAQACVRESALTPPLQEDGDGLQRAHDFLLAHCRERIALDTLAELAGTSRYQLIRQFRRRFGLTPHALQLDMKIRQARTLLQQGVSAVAAAYDTGFADQSHFHRAFKSRVAVTPLQYTQATPV
ncbi:AraC-like DNA-binding protein [Herbaspirillum rubrisubalbicans]|uniref:AraC family transcriptional regulator n=1 Tax=Herbaspirillum rubrisubalbicans Os34 TaxID=1235827 RepID=A0A6M3ZWE1_9BURK|nr:AraC family transcriptional regulator [Herbaspirillum rubrisubalbicans]MCP1574374.1 AraC-like DNA-binding protein [Herbaspirillum rubrisubalbicans]QJQ02856.1 AraC family transcriptional regulator [Herbaspirillum rubrisubalbicans Os34]